MRRAALIIAFVSLPILASKSLAADIPVPITKAPSFVPAPFSWTGIYLGAHGGYGWSDFKSVDLTFGDPGAAKASGVLGGIQAGFNYQIGSMVLGVEGEYSIADVKFTQSDPLGIGAPGNAVLKNDFFADLSGRLGYALDRWLVYGKGGVA